MVIFQEATLSNHGHNKYIIKGNIPQKNWAFPNTYFFNNDNFLAKRALMSDVYVGK